jgi:hypothetical protein
MPTTKPSSYGATSTETIRPHPLPRTLSTQSTVRPTSSIRGTSQSASGAGGVTSTTAPTTRPRLSKPPRELKDLKPELQSGARRKAPK